MIQNIAVENIKCNGCMNTIKTSLMKLDGVKNVEIDLEKEIVSVDGTIEKDILVHSLAKIGYPEIGNNDLIKKAKSFVSCAIGQMN
jgi:copper chaperone CopZ